MSHPSPTGLRTAGTARGVATVAPPQPRKAPRIPEIEGLRGVAIALIVVYHIWLNRVSGGVDAFFLLSGFLVTMSLVRSVERTGRVGLAAFYSRVARRIFPPALVVLVGVAVLTVLLLPMTRWRGILGDVIASSLYVVNWRLAHNSVDYLASRDAASPVQHYWSLAVQAQFYLVWPLLLAAAALLAAALGRQPRRALAVLLGAVFVASLAYSVYRTSTYQAFAYFDTLPRIWEFALGGLLWLGLPHLRPTRWVGVVLGWVGLVALVTCGIVLQAGTQFPGWAALWPTLAAALLIVTAGGGSRFGTDRVLRTGPLQALGGISYALYLWHWPILICYLAVTERAVPSARGGLLVAGVSLLAAVVTTRLVEERLPRSGLGQRSARSVPGGFALAAGFLAAVLVVAGGWAGLMHVQQARVEAAAPSGIVAQSYPGAAHLMEGGELPDVPYRPGPLAAKDDRAWAEYPGCEQNLRESEPLMCEVGAAEADRTIALVGASHAYHWLPALDVLGDRHGWRILSITKSGCLFSNELQYQDGEPDPACAEWNDNVLDLLARLRPDAVFTNSTRVTRAPEVVPEGYVAQWQAMADLGIRVLGIRDTPRPWIDVPECVERHGKDAARCGNPPEVYGLDQPDAAGQRTDLPDNVHLVDLTHLFCTSELCPSVIGNVLVYHDDSHISVTFARTLTPYLGAAILDATGW